MLNRSGSTVCSGQCIDTTTQRHMRLSTKGRYAVTAMIDLAMHQVARPVTLRSISDNQRISLPYLEQLFAKLRKSNLVKGARGPGGGYVLSRSAGAITVADIIVAVDEPLDITACDGLENCNAGERCVSHDLWRALSDQLYTFLSEIHLDQLLHYGRPAEQSGPVARVDGRVDGYKVALPRIAETRSPNE